MDNKKISLRQCCRLLFFDILGPGLLFLPDALAVQSGKDGGVAILIVTLLALAYAELLVKVMGRPRENGTRNLMEKALYGCYGVYFVLLGAYAVYLLADMVRSFLLEGESFWLIAALIVLLALYSRKTGPEGRARAFEILFWPALFLLAVLLALGLGELRPVNVMPVAADLRTAGGAILRVLLAFAAVQTVFFLPPALEDGISPAELKKGVKKSLMLSGLLLILLYEMLLGSFGRAALADSKMPVMIFSSNLVLPGGFLRRQEALVAGVCFAAVMALAGSCIQHGQHCFGRMKEGRWQAWAAAALIFLLCLWEHYHADGALELQKLLLILTPLSLLLPFLLSVGKSGRKRTVALALLVCLCFGGCSFEELEDKSFPMAAALSAKDGNCILTYQYMDLSQVSEKQKASESAEGLTAEASTLLGAMRAMEQKNGKSIDLNHAKVLLLERSYLEDGELVRQLIREGNRGALLSGNLLVFVTEDIEKITALQEGMDGDIGTYLEGLLQGDPAYRNVESFALKAWTGDYYEADRLCVLPKVSEENGLPVIDGYYGYLRDGATGESRIVELSRDEGLCAGICEGNVERMDLAMGGGVVQVENLRASYEFDRSNSRVLCHLTLYGDIDRDKSVKLQEEKEVEEYLCSIIRNAWDGESDGAQRRTGGIDLTNSYAHLNCHDRDICRAYENDPSSYRDDLCLQIDADFAEF